MPGFHNFSKYPLQPSRHYSFLFRNKLSLVIIFGLLSSFAIARELFVGTAVFMGGESQYAERSPFSVGSLNSYQICGEFTLKARFAPGFDNSKIGVEFGDIWINVFPWPHINNLNFQSMVSRTPENDTTHRIFYAPSMASVRSNTVPDTHCLRSIKIRGKYRSNQIFSFTKINFYIEY